MPNRLNPLIGELLDTVHLFIVEVVRTSDRGYRDVPIISPGGAYI